MTKPVRTMIAMRPGCTLRMVVMVVRGRVAIEVEAGNDKLIYDKFFESQTSVTSKNPYTCKLF